MSDYITYDAALVPAPFGLQNNGVICWGNSTLQFLMGMPALTRVLLDNETEFAANPFARAYIALLKAALAGHATGGESFEIIKLLIAQVRKSGMLGYGQECADEAFTAAITAFGSQRVERLFQMAYEYTIICAACKKSMNSRDTMFRLVIHGGRNEAANKKWFSDYLKAHISIAHDVACDCGQRAPMAQKLERLKLISEIIVITLNKFFTKDLKWYPEELEFPRVGGGSLRYRLIGKIEHSGTQLGGHYWAHSVRGDWKRLNDTGVGVGDPTPTAETFMIAYHMVGEPGAERG